MPAPRTIAGASAAIGVELTREQDPTLCRSSMKLFLLACLAGLPLCAAAEPRALRLAATDPAPTIDGRLDDAAWARAPIHDRFVEFFPDHKKPSDWRTTVQIVVTGDALVFGIRAYDPAPERIRAPLSRRDQVRRDQDFVSVVIDPVGLRRSAQFVRIGAAGAISDGMFTAEDDVEDFAPDFDVEAAVQRLPDGWSAELRWPLASLRYPYHVCPQAAASRRPPPEGGKEAWDGPAPPCEAQPWRVMVTRSIPREQSNLVVSAPLNRDALNFIAELEPIEGLGDLVEQVRERSFLQIRPEVTARATRERAPGQRRSDREISVGAEIKWRPRADWVIDATLNPDFSQVELDAPQLAGNTRFALSVPEKRPFFLESTDIVGGSQAEGADENRGLAAFYSRAITDPDYGLRATWRGASGEATLLSLRDAGGGLVLRPSAYATAAHAQRGRSQASYARGRMQLGEGLGVGLLGSSRDYGDGRHNRVFGADFGMRAGETDLLRGHLLASSTTAGFDAEGQALRTAAESGRRLWLGWQRRNEDWNNALHYERVDPRFANDNGFVSQAGMRRLTAQIHRRLAPRTLAPFGDWASFEAHELELQLKLQQTDTLTDARLGVQGGEMIERLVRPGVFVAAARNTGMWAELGLNAQRSHAGGRLHAPRTLTVGFDSNPGELLTFLSAELEWGRRLDVEADRLGNGANATVQANLRTELPLGWWLELEQRYGQGFVRAPEGRRAFNDRHAQTLAVLHFDARNSLRAIAQQTRYLRAAEPGLEAIDERGRNISLVFQHRVGLARIVSIGLTRARELPLQTTGTELFAKLVMAWQK